MQCTVCTVQCMAVVCSVQYALYNVWLLYAVYSMHCTMYGCCMQCTVCTVQCMVVVCSVQYALYNVWLLYAVYSMHCTMYGCCMQCTVCTVQCMVVVCKHSQSVLYTSLPGQGRAGLGRLVGSVRRVPALIRADRMSILLMLVTWSVFIQYEYVCLNCPDDFKTGHPKYFAYSATKECHS